MTIDSGPKRKLRGQFGSVMLSISVGLSVPLARDQGVCLKVLETILCVKYVGYSGFVTSTWKCSCQDWAVRAE